MKWYSKYLTIFGKSLSDVPETIVSDIRNTLAKFKCETPLASVVIIAHNEETRLLSCLWSLSDNICKYPVEIIGVNNNSTDRTSWAFDAAGIKWYLEEKKGPGYARTCGMEHAKGKYHICIDADTIYPPDYLQITIDELQRPGVVGVSSMWTFIPDGKQSKLGMFIYETLRDWHIKALARKSPEWIVRGMTFAYVTQYGREVGYKVNIKRGEDGSMALGLKKYGKIRLINSPKSRVITSTNTFDAKGSLWDNFRIEMVKGIKHIKRYFFSKNVYLDTDTNLIKNNPKAIE